jgi:hypothetical protein
MSRLFSYLTELVTNPVTYAGGKNCSIHMDTVPKLHVPHKMDVVVYDHTSGIQWVYKTDNALFYKVRDHVNVIATFRCTVPYHDHDPFKNRTPGLYGPMGVVYNSVFIPYVARTTGNELVETGQIPGPISSRSSVPIGNKPNRSETAYGFGCLHLPIDTIGHDGSIYFKHGGAMTFNVGISNGTVLFASGSVQTENGRLVGTSRESTSMVYFSGNDSTGFANPLVNDGLQTILSNTFSTFFDVNYESLHVYKGGTLLSHAERHAINNCTTQSEILKLFEVFARRYVSFPLYTWSTLFAVHDGRVDTDLDRTAMKSMMLHYRRSPRMDLKKHLSAYFNKYPSECNRIPDGWYYAYDLVDTNQEHRYKIQQDVATWRLASDSDTVLATYDISYANNQCVFQQRQWDNGFLWHGDQRMTVDFTHGNYIQQCSTGTGPFHSFLMSKVRRDPRTLYILQ